MANRDFREELKQEVYDKYTIKYNSQARDNLESALPKVTRGTILGVLGAGAGVGLSFLLPGVGLIVGAGVGFALAGPISQVAYSTVYSAKNLSANHFSKVKLTIEDATSREGFEDLDNQQLNILGVKRIAEICDMRARDYANVLKNTSGTDKYTITDANENQIEVSERKLKKLIKENEEVARKALEYIMNIAVEQSNKYRNLDAGSVKVVNTEASKQYCMFMLQVAGQTASNLVAERINLGEVNPYKGTILRAMENKALIATTRGKLDTLPVHNVTNEKPSFNERIELNADNKEDLLTLYTEMFEKRVLEYYQEQKNIKIDEQGRIAENLRAQIIRLNNLIRADKKLANWLNTNGLLDELLKNRQTDIALIRLAQGISLRLTPENQVAINNAIQDLKNANALTGNTKVKQTSLAHARQNLIIATEDAIDLIHQQGEQQGLATGKKKIDALERRNSNLVATLSEERIDNFISEKKLGDQLDASRKQNEELTNQLNTVNSYLENLKDRGNITAKSLHDAVSLIKLHIDSKKLPTKAQARYKRLVELDNKAGKTNTELGEYTALIKAFLTYVGRELQYVNSQIIEQEQELVKAINVSNAQSKALKRHSQQEATLKNVNAQQEQKLLEEQEKSKLQQAKIEEQAETIDSEKRISNNWQVVAEKLINQVNSNNKNNQQAQQQKKEIIAKLMQMIENLRKALRNSQIDTQTANEQIAKLEEILQNKDIHIKALDEKIESLKAEIEAKEEQNQDLQRQNKNYNVVVDAMIQQLEKAQQGDNSSKLQTKINILKGLIVKIKSNLEASNVDVKTLKEQVKVLKKELKQSNLSNNELNSQIEALENEIAQREQMLTEERQLRTAFKQRVTKAIDKLDNGNLEAMQTAYTGLYKKCIENGLTDAEAEDVLKNLAQQIENSRAKSNNDAIVEQNLGFATDEDEIVRRLTDVFGTRIDTTILQNDVLNTITDRNRRISEALTSLEQQLADAQKDAKKQTKRADKAEKTAKTQTKRAETAERERDDAVKGRDALSVELENGRRKFESQIASLTEENENAVAENRRLEEENRKLWHEKVSATEAMFKGALKINDLEEQNEAVIKGAEEMHEQNLAVVDNLLARIDGLLAELEEKDYQIRDVSHELHKYKDRFDHPALERQFGKVKNGLRRRCNDLRDAIEHCVSTVEIKPTLELAKKVLLAVDLDATYDVKDENGWRVRYYTDADIQSFIVTYKKLSEEVDNLTNKINKYNVKLF